LTPSRVLVFDAERQYFEGRKDLTESTFSYLNRSAKPISAASRTLIEEWLSYVPESEHNAFRARFRCGRNEEFDSAFHELFLHEFLRRQNCSLEFPTRGPEAPKRQDFLVRAPGEVDFFLEARLSTTDTSFGPDNSPLGSKAREFLMQIDIGDYKLDIIELTPGKQDFSKRQLRQLIQHAIASSDNSDKPIAIPEFKTEDGWRIRLQARRGIRGGFYVTGGTWSGPSYPIRDALIKKASKYDRGQEPYIIAVNTWNNMLTQPELEENLFGVRPGIEIAGMTPELARGFWSRQGAGRVSAVLFTQSLHPETVLTGSAYACLYLNPSPNSPYEGLLMGLPTFRQIGGEVREFRGKPCHELMGLTLLDSSLLN
jgi:hypothetical protein